MTPRPASPHQTKLFLMKRFEAVGIRPKTRFGQNFLIDLNLHRLIVETAELTQNDVALEVGCGTGAITALLAERAAAVVAVEVDRQLAVLASEHLIAHDNVSLLEQDALHGKNRISDAVLQAVDERLNEQQTRRFKLVANLPYNIATPLLSNLLALSHPPHTMTATIQKELADRIVSAPRSKNYGSLSAWVQSQATAEIVRVLPPQVFWPRPKVQSAIVHIAFDPAKRSRILDLGFWHDFLRKIFLHRRKFLRSCVVSTFKDRLDKQQIDEVLTSLGHGPQARAEELSVDELFALSEACRATLAEA